MIKQVSVECTMNDGMASKSKIRLAEPRENQLMINTPMGVLYVGKRELINAMMMLEQPIDGKQMDGNDR